jgi:hypothetical protein
MGCILRNTWADDDVERRRAPRRAEYSDHPSLAGGACAGCGGRGRCELCEPGLPGNGHGHQSRWGTTRHAAWRRLWAPYDRGLIRQGVCGRVVSRPQFSASTPAGPSERNFSSNPGFSRQPECSFGPGASSSSSPMRWSAPSASVALPAPTMTRHARAPGSTKSAIGSNSRLLSALWYRARWSPSGRMSGGPRQRQVTSRPITNYGDSAFNSPPVIAVYRLTSCMRKSAVFGADSVYRTGAPEEIRTPDPQIHSLCSIQRTLTPIRTTHARLLQTRHRSDKSTA